MSRHCVTHYWQLHFFFFFLKFLSSFVAMWDVAGSKESEYHFKGNHLQFNFYIPSKAVSCFFFFSSKRVILLHIHTLTLDLEFLEDCNCFLFVSLSSPAQGLKDCRCSVNVYWKNVWGKNKGMELVCMRGGNWFQSHNNESMDRCLPSSYLWAVVFRVQRETW